MTGDGGGSRISSSDRAAGQPPAAEDSTHTSGRAVSHGEESSEIRVPAPLQLRDPARYQVLVEHGRGGLGRVFRAHDKELERDVALKELLVPTYGSELRFFREALITARLEHPGIVPVHEAGRWPDGTPFYTMKLVAGRPLTDLLAEAQTLDARLALVPHVIAVADAIAYAHDRKIIHRDLKPSNVIIGQFGETIVIDWGLAKELSDTAADEPPDGPYRTPAVPDLTCAGSILGTPAYMSPEQARGDRADTRSDVYSIGAMLFQLCTGSAPRPGLAGDELRRALRPVPADLSAIALKCLSPLPAERYPDAAVLAADLHAFDAGARIAARTYSPAAVLKHWIDHHRGLAFSVALSAAVALIVGTVSLRKVIHERNVSAAARRTAEQARASAEADRHTAEKERDLAVRSEAAMLLETDPTRAEGLLASRREHTPEEALLLARARGTGTAKHVITLLPFKIYGAEADRELETLAIGAADNKLRLIHLASGRVDVVEDKLLEPTLLAGEDGKFTYARRGRGGPELVRAGDSARPIPLGALREKTIDDAVASPSGLYLLGGSKALTLLSPDGRLRRVREGIRGIARYGGGLLACTRADLLQIDHGATTRIASCRHDGAWRAFATSPDGFAVQASPRTILVQQRGARREIPIAEWNHFALAPGGLLVGASRAGSAWYVPPGGNARADGPPSQARVSAVAADGALGAWGYMDGVARVRDTRTGATWTFVGHSGPIYWIFVSEAKGRVVTVGGPEVRVWRIPPFALRPLGGLSLGALNAATSPDGKWVAFDGTDGVVGVVGRDPASGGVRMLHRHGGAAYGVTWRGREACSSGWDGVVFCTDPVTGRTTVVAEHDRPIRFVHSAGKVLAYTVEDGTVWAHVAGAPASTLLYRHRGEPFRVAVSPSGDVASGDNDGGVMVYERATGAVHTARLHTHRVFQIAWRGDELQTSSYDGTVRTWSKTLEPKTVVSFEQPIRELELLRSGWVANVGGTRLWLQSGDTTLDLHTGPTIWDLSVSSDRRFVGAVVGDDLIVYDLERHALAAIRIGDASSYCAQFVDAATMFVCGPYGEVFSIDVPTLPFVNLSRSTNP